VGFSQGAIISLESTQVDAPPLASRVIALAGRFAAPVRRAPANVHLHLIHGEQDAVVPARSSIDAAGALESLGARATLNILPGVGHSIDARALGLVLGYLGRHPTALR
jgi:phospholipase/carboxylesterase